MLVALAWPAASQVFDNTGNNLLNGSYYFREVIYTSSVDVAIYGGITFSGTGSYSISATTFDDSSLTAQPYAASGTYTISASGFGFLSNQILGQLGGSNSVTYGLVSNGIFIGSSTESGINDVFIAAPISSQNAGTFNGAYTLDYIDPLGEFIGFPFDAQLTMSPNGGGGIGSVGVTAYSSSSTPTTQTISGVKYSVSNSAFVLSFPTGSSSNLLQGPEYLYSTPDGSFVFGGSPQNFDMIVGVRNSTSGGNFGGLFYQAGMDEDLTSESFDTYYGSFNANSTALLGHQRVLSFESTAFGFTYGDYSTLSSNGTYNDPFTVENYTGGNGGSVRIGYGIGPSIGISVAVQAPNFSGGGVYLNPTGVLNSASSAPFTAGVSPGELITLIGTNIGPSALQVAQRVPFPTNLGGVQVLINNIAAPIYYVSAGQVAAIVPYETTSAIAQIQVVYNSTLSNAITEPVNLTTPGIFTEPAGGAGYAAALHPDFSLVSPDSPAQIGEIIAVYVTGLGDVFPSIPDGSAASSTALSNTSNTITATVGGVAATVNFAGLAPGLAGLYQVNVTIPSGVTAGDNYLELLGPDSDALEALVTISDSGLGVQAKDTRPQALHRRNPGAHLLPRVHAPASSAIRP
jgi:uncharacterized protein (TIGR03437 family)